MKRSSGVLMHVSSLWGEYSHGSFGKAAREWIDFLCEGGFKYWQVLPFCLPDFCNSPYKSFSAFSVNPYMIDLEILYDKGLLTRDEISGAVQKTPYSCEFERLYNERYPLLLKAAKRFNDKNAVSEYIKKNRQCEKFCEFMGRRAANGNTHWREWKTGAADADTVIMWQFILYEFNAQWQEIKKYANGKGVKIIGDIPIYVDYDSSDVWANPEMFMLDNDNIPTSAAGVPPDYFAKDGQLWGNPLYNWDVMARDKFSWWKERINFMTSIFDGIRIDHFRAIESYYSVPAGEKTAKNGKWIKGPGMDFVNAVKQAADGKLIIAEDLGDITPEVHKLVSDSGFPGMRVMQFGFFGDTSSPHIPHNYINNSVCYTGTHDNNTILGYIWDLDENTRKNVLEYFGYSDQNWDRCYDTILRGMLASHGGLVIFPVQDLLLYGNDTRINIPGKSEGNWTFRITKEQLNTVDMQKFRKWNEMYGRA